MSRITLVTDREGMSGQLKAELEGLGHQVSITNQSEAGRLGQRPDLIILDPTTTAADAAKICRALRTRSETRDTPVLALSNPEGLKDLDLAAGLDDFLLYPCTIMELEARIRLVLWRKDRVDAKEIVKTRDLVIDTARYEVSLRGRRVDLTFKEYELLVYLAKHRGRVFTREALLSRIWGYDYYGGTRTVDVHIRRLRSKLEVGGSSFIETVRGVGYKFVG